MKFVLRIAGIRATGSAYPSAEQTISSLKASGVILPRDLGTVLPVGLHLWRFRQPGSLRRVWLLLRLGLGNAASLMRVLLDRRFRDAPVYVPYPAIFFLWLVSWLPRKIRPACIADAYISVWDSMFNDRSVDGVGSGAARILSIESRALRAAVLVLVDTEANKQFYVEQFGLEPRRVRSLPLAVDAAPFISRRSQQPDGRRIRVVFVGTMIPLHGIGTILDAAGLLSHRDDIEFRLVGDGQMATEIQRRIDSGAARNITWISKWISLDAIAEEIANSHICLGIFGGTAKSSRVFPFKLYYALAGGRAVITQDMMSMPAGMSFPPLVTVPPMQPESLANAIEQLASDHAGRENLCAVAAAYYDKWLDNQVLITQWGEILGGFNRSAGNPPLDLPPTF